VPILSRHEKDLRTLVDTLAPVVAVHTGYSPGTGLITRVSAVTHQPQTSEGRRARPTEFQPGEMDIIKISPALTNQQIAELRALISRFRDCYAYELTEIGTTSVVTADPQADGQPVYTLPYPRGPLEEELLQKEVDKLLTAGIIRDTRKQR